MDHLSQHLNLNKNQIMKKLKEEGSNFQKIKNDVFERKAKEMLKENYSISKISFYLGFSELREFRRAFIRWTGESPSSYKRRFKVNKTNS